ncbi:MAG TPA: glucose-6-phosphate dehydrogenase, partial [Burkholderiales bacterium]|nr:glucose-6-phosphate dehydrogenase [Burkholderiales bacterium]
GDLSSRLILPALFNLHLDGQLPQHFMLFAVDRTVPELEKLALHYRESIARYSRRGRPKDEEWANFSSMIRCIRADLSEESGYHELASVLNEQEKAWGGSADQIFYLAIPPFLFEPVTRGLGNSNLANNRERARIVVEKPLGHDLESSRAINQALSKYFEERQIFRIDHFLGKETVQNILAMRFANPMFEPVWNRRYIDHVAITVAETLGVEHRGGYYEKAGALRDMVQNHLLQLLCLVAMEAPVAYDADDIRSKKMDVLRAIRPIAFDEVREYAARGQYGPGWIGGKALKGYRQEPMVDSSSNIETYAALKLHVDNWRWQDVPFYLRTGKRLASSVSEISIRFQDVPHKAFPASVGLDAQPARLVILIQPEQGIVLKFIAKEPGSPLRLRPVDMRFSYREAFKVEAPEAYETLLRDIMAGDATLFMRADQVEAAWQIIMPVLEVWQENHAPDFPNYPCGAWGPESAELLVARDGRSWLTPTHT